MPWWGWVAAGIGLAALLVLTAGATLWWVGWMLFKNW